MTLAIDNRFPNSVPSGSRSGCCNLSFGYVWLTVEIGLFLYQKVAKFNCFFLSFRHNRFVRPCCCWQWTSKELVHEERVCLWKWWTCVASQVSRSTPKTSPMDGSFKHLICQCCPVSCVNMVFCVSLLCYFHNIPTLPR